MPKRHLLDGQFESWNISKVAGYNGGASNNDVKLVQFLLNVYKKYMENTGTPITTKWLATDGIFGPNTSNALWSLQLRTKGRVLVDGKVSQMQGGSALSTGATVWTLAWMENVYTMFTMGLSPNTVITPAQFNWAMSRLRYDPVLDVAVRTEMLSG